MWKPSRSPFLAFLLFLTVPASTGCTQRRASDDPVRDEAGVLSKEQSAKLTEFLATHNSHGPGTLAIVIGKQLDPKQRKYPGTPRTDAMNDKSGRGATISFLGQSFGASAGDNLSAPKAFDHRFTARSCRDDALNKTTVEINALVGRQ